MIYCLCAGLLLLLLVQSQKRDRRHLHNLEAASGNITLCFTLATETGNQDLILLHSDRQLKHNKTYVLIDEVQATVPRNEGGDLLAVLNKLNADALSNGRVRLLGLNTTSQR